MQPQLLFSLVIFLVFLPAMALLAIVTSRTRAKTESEKRFVTLYCITLMSTFAAGALVRTVQQNTRSQWQDGFVAIFMGVYISLWGLPTLWQAWHYEHVKYGRIKKGFALLISLLLGLAGASLIGLGLYRAWVASN